MDTELLRERRCQAEASRQSLWLHKVRPDAWTIDPVGDGKDIGMILSGGLTDGIFRFPDGREVPLKREMTLAELERFLGLDNPPS